jgi:thiamine kinase-like enzyme
MILLKKIIENNPLLFDKYNISLNSKFTKYNSRRNNVYKIDTLNNTSFVLKYFPIKENNYNIVKEIKILNLLENNVKVPKILFSAKSFYLMKYIPGITLLDYLEISEKNSINNNLSENTKLVLLNYLKWLNNFYETLFLSLNKTMILSDVNLKNLIVSDNNEISGIDFETISSGEIIRDLGKICAYILFYDPTFTDYKYNCVSFLEKNMVSIFKVDIKRLTEEKIKHLNNIRIRRNLKHNQKCYNI